MKSMSQVARVEDCPETLEEARVLLAQQSASIKAQWQGNKELSAQLTAVTKERDDLENWCEEMHETHAKLLSVIVEKGNELTAALARAEKAEEDTRRLDWLEATQQRGHYCGVFRGDTLTRAAIDAALTPTKEPTP